MDTSDHEVNIKILLADSVSRGDLAPADRNRLLHEMTGEVGTLVLRHNYHQNRAIAAARAQAPAMLHVHARYLRKLERDRRLRRRLEVLPGDKVIAERRSAGMGLTGPEFAVLLAQAKIAAAQEMLGSALPDDPYLRVGAVRLLPGAAAGAVRRPDGLPPACAARSSPRRWSTTWWTGRVSPSCSG